MHWHFHFDGKQNPIKNDTSKLSWMHSISNDDLSDHDDIGNPLSTPATDSSNDNTITARSYTQSIRSSDSSRRRRDRFFHRKSSTRSSSSIDGESRSDGNTSSVADDEHAKHKLFQIHVHVPWKSIKKPQRSTSFGSLSSFDISDAEMTHSDEHHVDIDHHIEEDSHVASLPSTVSQRSVHFSTVKIREYDLILGDHPYCSNGVPTQLGWEHKEQKAVNLDHYEFIRGPQRKCASQFRISATARMDLLLANTDNDYTKADLRRAERKLYKDRCNRSKKDTLKFFNMS